jgi:hypothetical protein
MTSSFSHLGISRLAFAIPLAACGALGANPSRDAGDGSAGDPIGAAPVDSGGMIADAAGDSATQPDAAGHPADVQPDPECVGLFGKPNRATGLDDTQCSPVCTCGERTWSPPEYTPARIASLRSWVHTNPFEPIENDPYESPPAAGATDAVCGVLPAPGAPRVYSLVTYASASAAHDAGAMITHTGACGTCSTLTDLGAYIENQDLTEPVRRCGVDNALAGKEAHIACLQGLGFTLPCAQSWYFNTLHTRRECGAICVVLLGASYNRDDGSLNACLQCDEDKSGAVFKASAGRTRRNSGLANAMCRPCSEVSRVEHIYE